MTRPDREPSEPPEPSVPSGPPDQRPFTEPWQAQVFALTVHLHERGVFTWPEWAEALSAHVTRPGAADDGSDYYDHWTDALQSIVTTKGLAADDTIGEVAAAWERAAEATPHGSPIELANDPGPG